jgi:hypothetical protein
MPANNEGDPFCAALSSARNFMVTGPLEQLQLLEKPMHW